jgi:hypothetical protein
MKRRTKTAAAFMAGLLVGTLDQTYRASESADMVSRLVAAAYRESGEPTPADVRRTLERWEDAAR